MQTSVHFASNASKCISLIRVQQLFTLVYSFLGKISKRWNVQVVNTAFDELSQIQTPEQFKSLSSYRTFPSLQKVLSGSSPSIGGGGAGYFKMYTYHVIYFILFYTISTEHSDFKVHPSLCESLIHCLQLLLLAVWFTSPGCTPGDASKYPPPQTMLQERTHVSFFSSDSFF